MKLFAVKSLVFFFSITGTTLLTVPVLAQTEEAGLEEKVNLELQWFDSTQKLEAAVPPLVSTSAENSVEEQAFTATQEDLLPQTLAENSLKSVEKQAEIILEEDLPEVVANQPVESQEWRQPITNSAALQPLPKEADNFNLESSFESDIPLLAQTDIELGRLTRSSFSYIGVGGNIGLTGDTGVGEGAFVVNAKIALSRSLSLRPAAHFSDNTAFLASLTYDFNLPGRDPFEPVQFFPFVGGGIILNTEDDSANSDSSDVGFLLTGGVDYPLSRDFTANATLNIGFLDETEVGIVLGVGYTFSSF